MQPISLSATKTPAGEDVGELVFLCTKNDNKLAPPIDEQKFIQIMDREVFKDSANSWVAPLPFCSPRRRLPNNREYAYKRLKALCHTLEKKPEMKEHYLDFIQKMLDNDQAELAPSLQDGQECWYLPSFGVYHPRKPGKIRIVFDSSARYDGVSLNDVLLTEPDLNKSLLGVLVRFRTEPAAVTGDIEHMFHCFVVKEEHRDYLRFLWFRNNDMNSDIVDYRMKVHVFGNTPPAVAIYGLRRAAREGEESYGSDVRRFVEEDFYVDDPLKSFATEEEAIGVLQRAQEALAGTGTCKGDYHTSSRTLHCCPCGGNRRVCGQ